MAGIHHKNLVELVHLLVSLIRHFRAPIRLPENVYVNVLLVQKKSGQLISRTISEQLTGTYDEFGMRLEQKDAIDALFSHAPDKLQLVKRSLISFVNRHLNKINIECYTGQTGVELDPMQFSDGLLIVFLMGMLDGFYVPLGKRPDSACQRECSTRVVPTLVQPVEPLLTRPFAP